MDYNVISFGAPGERKGASEQALVFRPKTKKKGREDKCPFV